MDYSENAGKQYRIQAGRGDVGRYVILPGCLASGAVRSLIREEGR